MPLKILSGTLPLFSVLLSKNTTLQLPCRPYRIIGSDLEPHSTPNPGHQGCSRWIFQVKSSLKSSQWLRNFVKSSHDQVKSGQNLVKSSSQVIKSSRLEHPYRTYSIGVQASFFQVKSSLKSSQREEFVSSQVTIKSSQARILVKSSSQAA